MLISNDCPSSGHFLTPNEFILPVIPAYPFMPNAHPEQSLDCSHSVLQAWTTWSQVYRLFQQFPWLFWISYSPVPDVQQDLERRTTVATGIALLAR